MSRKLTGLLLLMAAVVPIAVVSGQVAVQRQAAWNQWGGPERDFSTADVGLALTWPSAGPPRLWRRELGDSFSSIVTDGQRAFAHFRDGTDDVVVAMRMTDGATLWESRNAAPFDERCTHKLGPAPRATPLLAGTVLITASAGGLINAFNPASGARMWTRDLTEGGAGVRPCGYTSSPLAIGGLVITAGAAHGLVALDVTSGRIVWRAGESEPSYASPILVNVGGRPELILLTAAQIIGVDAATGTLDWQHPHPAEYGANVSTPVWSPAEGLLFVSSAYSGGSRTLQIKRESAGVVVKELWNHQRVRVHFGNIVRMGSTVYASSGDTGSAPLAAVDLLSGEILWRSRAVGRATLVAVGARLILLDEDGNLVLATPTDTGLMIHSQAETLPGVTWTPPTISGTTLLIRNRHEVVAFDLGVTAARMVDRTH